MLENRAFALRPTWLLLLLHLWYPHCPSLLEVQEAPFPDLHSALPNCSPCLFCPSFLLPLKIQQLGSSKHTVTGVQLALAMNSHILVVSQQHNTLHCSIKETITVDSLHRGHPCVHGILSTVDRVSTSESWIFMSVAVLPSWKSKAKET